MKMRNFFPELSRLGGYFDNRLMISPTEGGLVTERRYITKIRTIK